MSTSRVRLCDDPRFRLLLVASKLTPGKKVWKVMEAEKTEVKKP